MAPTALTNLALGLQDRYLRSGNPDDFARAIACCEQVCGGVEPIGACVMLGDLLRRRYESTGKRTDLTRAVALLRDALQATPPRSPERPRRLVDLGIALLDQDAQSGEPGALYAALKVFGEAMQAVAVPSPDRPGCLVHRSLASYRRYESAGTLDDLNRAAYGLEEAVRTAGAGCVDTVGWTVDLAAVLHERAAAALTMTSTGRSSSLEAVSAPASGAFDTRSAAMNDWGTRCGTASMSPATERSLITRSRSLASRSPLHP